MATCLVSMRIREGEAEAFEALARSLYADSTGKEPGMIRYEYWRGREPNRYYCLESFDDYAAFLAHETAPHHEAAAEPIMALIEQFDLEWVDPVAGASPLPATREFSPPAAATERERLYAEMFPLSLLAWWLRLREPVAGTV
jgi:quinol monooxygenase YgiN